MAITPSRKTMDILGPLAWTSSLALLALKKIQKSIPLTPDDKRALAKLAESTAELHKAILSTKTDSFVRDFQPMASSSYQSLCSLAAISVDDSSVTSFQGINEAEKDLSYINKKLEKADLIDEEDLPKVGRARSFCSNLLQYVNSKRPTHHDYASSRVM